MTESQHPAHLLGLTPPVVTLICITTSLLYIIPALNHCRGQKPTKCQLTSPKNPAHQVKIQICITSSSLYIITYLSQNYINFRAKKVNVYFPIEVLLSLWICSLCQVSNLHYLPVHYTLSLVYITVTVIWGRFEVLLTLFWLCAWPPLHYTLSFICGPNKDRISTFNFLKSSCLPPCWFSNMHNHLFTIHYPGFSNCKKLSQGWIWTDVLITNWSCSSPAHPVQILTCITSSSLHYPWFKSF